MADSIILAVIVLVSLLVFAGVTLYNVMRGVRVSKESVIAYLLVLAAAVAVGLAVSLVISA